MLTLTNYQARAAATAQPAAYDRAYLIPGIVGEVGELFGQRAKAVWHGWDNQKLSQELVSEYGDICWMTAILLDLEGSKGATDHLLGQPRTLWGEELDPWHILLQRATGLHLFYVQRETQRYLASEAMQLWLVLEAYCLRITGADFDTVLEANLAKLAGRVQRGTLVGSGDHR